MVSSRNLVNFVAEFSDVVAERSDKGRVDADAEMAFFLGQMQRRSCGCSKKKDKSERGIAQNLF